MKKRLFYLPAALVVVLVTLLASCDKTKQDYTLAIPSDALMVVSMDVKSLGEKGGFEQYANHPEMKKLKAEITNSFSGEAAGLMNELVEEPAKSGIDLCQKIYFYLQMVDAQVDAQNMLNMSAPPSLGFVLPVKDLSALNKTVATLASESGLAAPAKASGADYYTLVNDDFAICYNESALLIIFGKEDRPLQVAQQMIALNPEYSIHKTNSFKELQNSKRDIAMLLNPGAIPSQAMETYYGGQLPLEPGCDYEDLSMLFSLNFAKGEVVLGAQTFVYSEAWEAVQKKGLAMVGKVDKKYLKMIPADAMAILAFNMDGEKYMEEYQTMIHNMLNLVGGMSGMGKVYKEAFDIFGYLKGNAVVYAQVKNMMNFSVQGFIEGDEAGLNSFTQMIPNGMGIESGRKGDYTYIAMNAEEASGKAFDPSFADTKAGKEVADSYASIYLNMKEANKFIPLLMGGQGDPATQFGVQMLSGMDYMLFHQVEPNYGEWKIVMVDQKENPLKGYVAMLMELAKNFN